MEGQAASSPSGLGRTSNVLSFLEIGSFFLSSISCASLSYSGQRGVFLVTLELGVIDGGGGAGATFAWIGVFFLYLSTFATFVVSADPHCIFCQLVQER